MLYTSNNADGTISSGATFTNGPVVTLSVTNFDMFGMTTFVCDTDAGWFSYDGVIEAGYTDIGLRCVNRNAATGALSSLSSYSYPTMVAFAMQASASYIVAIDDVGLRVLSLALSNGPAVITLQSANIALSSGVTYYRRMWMPPITSRGVYFTADGVLKYARIVSLVPTGLTTIDTLGNSAVDVDFDTTETNAFVSTTNNVITYAVDETTTTPTITLPATGTTYGNPIPLSFTIGEAALGGTASVSFTGSTTITFTITVATSCVLSINPLSIVAPISGTGCSLTATSASSIPSGSYTVTVSYQDIYTNPAATASNSGVVVDALTLPITASAPASGGKYGLANIPISYTLPEAAGMNTLYVIIYDSTGTARLTLVGTSAGGTTGLHSYSIDINSLAVSSSNAFTSTFGPGITAPYAAYTFSYTYQDTRFNPASVVNITNVILVTSTEAATLVLPTAGYVYPSNGMISVQFSLPRVATLASVKSTWVSSTNTIILTHTYAQGTCTTTCTKSFPASNPLLSVDVFTISGASTLPAGVYNVSLSHTVSLTVGTPPAANPVTVANVVVFPYGAALTVAQPMTGAHYAGTMSFAFVYNDGFYATNDIFRVVMTSSTGYTVSMIFQSDITHDIMPYGFYTTIQTADQIPQTSATLLSMTPDTPLPEAQSGKLFTITVYWNATIGLNTYAFSQVAATGVNLTTLDTSACSRIVYVPMEVIQIIYDETTHTVTVINSVTHNVTVYNNTQNFVMVPCPTCSTCVVCDDCEECEVCSTPTTTVVTTSCTDPSTLSIILIAVGSALAGLSVVVFVYLWRKYGTYAKMV